MSLETLSELGEFVGGFGVILSLVYVAIQVRTNTNYNQDNWRRYLLSGQSV